MLEKGKFTWIRWVSIPVFSFVNAWVVAPLSTTIVWLLAHKGLCINKLFLGLLTTFTNPLLPTSQVGAFWLMLLLPPILLDKVANFLCTSPGYLHVQLV